MLRPVAPRETDLATESTRVTIRKTASEKILDPNDTFPQAPNFSPRCRMTQIEDYADLNPREVNEKFKLFLISNYSNLRGNFRLSYTLPIQSNPLRT